VPVFEGKRGNPVLFDRSLFQELRGLTGDIGGRVLLEKYAEAVFPVPAGRAVVVDIDTPEDYASLKGGKSGYTSKLQGHKNDQEHHEF
jgi:molybdenum cofactor cytidylyltransferase